MADAKFNPARNDSEVVETFRKLVNEYKDAIRVSVLGELIESCYGPQALLDGEKIRDVIDFKFWIEMKLQVARERQAAKERVLKNSRPSAPPITKKMLKREWAAKRKAAEQEAIKSK
jgi:hypothetical protein